MKQLFALFALCITLPLTAWAETGFSWVVQPKYPDAGSAYQGIVPLKEGGKWGLMGRDGAWIVPPQLDAIGNAGDDRIAVQMAGKWGAVDLAGNVAIAIEFEAIGTPAEVTPVKWQGQWYALNRDGTPQDALLAIDTLIGNDGTCVTGMLGTRPVIDSRATPPRQTALDSVDKLFGPSEGHAVIIQNGKRGFAHCASGSISILPEFDEARRFSDGLAAVRSGDRWSYTSIYGGYEFPLKFTGAREFSEGLAPVQDAGGKWGYIDRTGKMVIAAQFDQAYSFSDGIAGVKVGDLRGLISPDGSYAADPAFQDFWRHDGGVAPVKTGDLWGVIAPNATDPTTRMNLPLAALAETLRSRPAAFALVPSTPHWYFAQDVVSLHSIHITPDRSLMLTILRNAPGGEVAIWDFQSRRLIRKIEVPEVTQSVVLPGTSMLAAGTASGHIVLLDAVTGAALHSLHAFDGAVLDMVIAPDGTMMAATDGRQIRLWSLADGVALPPIRHVAQKVRFTADGSGIVAGGMKGGLTRFSLEGAAQATIAGTAESPDPTGLTQAVPTMALGPGGVLVNLRSDLVQQADGFFASISRPDITTETGSRSLALPENLMDILTLDISDDGQWLALSGAQSEDFAAVIMVLDLTDGSTVFTQVLDREYPGEGIAHWLFSIDRMAFVPGTKDLILIGAEGQDIVQFDPELGRITAAFAAPLVNATNETALLDGSRFYTSGGDGIIWVWDLAAGRLERQIDVGVVAGSEEMLLNDGTSIFLQNGLEEDVIGAVDIATGTARPVTPEEMAHVADQFAETGGMMTYPPEIAALLERLPNGGLVAVALAGGRIGVESDPVGLHRAYDLATGDLLVQFLATPDGEWLVLTPEGFFDASENGAKLVSVASGLRAFSVDQVYQALYRPDLVREKLAGDPEGRVRDAAARLDLSSILQTGPAPFTRFSLPYDGTKANDEVIEVQAELRDEGGGVGRVEWRVNGRTIDVQTRAAEAMDVGDGLPDGTTLAKTRVPLEPGQNVIEIVAYNAAGLLASAPRTLTVEWDGVASSVPPALHVLAVGVNDYADGRLALKYAAADARAFAEAIGAAGKGLFSAVTVTTLLDTQVTEAQLDTAFTTIGDAVKPQDVFIFFLAGHGKTLDGKYYFIPQDFRFSGDDPIRTGGIDQDRWQEWSARVKARKAVMIYDTCESGSLTGTRSVDTAIAQSAAVQRLTRATGRTILSASTDDAPALEGYRGHGVMTYALLAALQNGDTNGNATIEVTELAGYIDQQVPEISSSAFGFRQVPQMSIKGSDFALGAQMAVLGATEETFPAMLTHVVAGGTEVRAAPEDAAPVMVIDTGVFFGVYRIEERDGWARVAKDGHALGWVPAAALTPLQ